MPWGTADPRKPHHLEQVANPFGSHDRVAFAPARNYPLRCPHCSNLMAPDFLDEGACPNCRQPFTKAQARDMFIEALQVHVQHGGWSPAIIEALKRLKGSGYVNRELDVREMNSTARNVAAHHLNLREQMQREERAKKALPAALRNMSSVSKALRRGPL
jgi:hypothetical protein